MGGGLPLGRLQNSTKAHDGSRSLATTHYPGSDPLSLLQLHAAASAAG
jgi:hypothetical protein